MYVEGICPKVIECVSGKKKRKKTQMCLCQVQLTKLIRVYPLSSLINRESLEKVLYFRGSPTRGLFLRDIPVTRALRSSRCYPYFIKEFSSRFHRSEIRVHWSPILYGFNRVFICNDYELWFTPWYAQWGYYPTWIQQHRWKRESELELTKKYTHHLIKEE